MTSKERVRSVSISSLCRGVYDGPHATPKLFDEGKAVFLGIREISDDGHLNLATARWVAEADYERWTRRVVPCENDIVFTYEATLHRYARIPKDLVCCLGRRTALIRPDPGKVNPEFLYHYMFSPAWRSQVEANVISGATVDRIPLIKFPDFVVRLPPREAQDRIAATLTAYDSLIINISLQRERLCRAKALMLPRLIDGSGRR
ncbi:MAG: restriction endonuclease subunit S [Candidatus Accumulibacter meliphilus]|jgi:type I restriction enzyme S subunit|uniref:Restriction endonuclease subunit S n=1 Tax=Candidatus Accumulibacter meliphilus TaxID=2211374 RepID=A0A369XQK6_9PROT|nr:MAG: restriction endonuclease subunit S [Candidatus Accumulibacter meliphilus]